MKRTIRDVALGTLLSSHLLTSQPATAQGLESRKTDLIENFENKKTSIDKYLISLLSNNKNKISYFVEKPTKAYYDSDKKQEWCIIPTWTYLRENQIDNDLSTEELVCYTIKWKNIWIPKIMLSPIDEILINQYLKPKTEKAIVVDKSNRKLLVYNQYGKNLVKEFSIALSPMETWDKTIEWDGNAPEGKYYICYKNPASAFWENPETWSRLWSLQISYPNIQDAIEWLISGEITKAQYQWINNSIQQKKIPSQWTPLWNYIMIHWGGSEEDWTLWCIWLNDEDMLRLYNTIWTWTDIFIW